MSSHDVSGFIRSPQSVWPEVRSYGFRPSRFGMEETRPCLFLQVPDPLFGYAVLEVSADSAKGNALAFLLHVFHEEIVGKAAVVRMIVLDLS